MFTRKLAAAVGVGAAVAGGYYYYQQQEEAAAKPLKNSAFVFIKPHANNKATQELVRNTLAAKKIKVVQEGEFTGEQIDKNMFIDQHYYAIASKATLLQPADIPVPPEKFQAFAGKSWSDALKEGSVYNALQACEYLGVDADGIDKLWGKCKKVKLGGGFYCGLVEVAGKKPIYTFNAFFMSMRNKFVQPGTSIHYYVVEFDADDVSWEQFRGDILGPTNPSSAPAGSLRGLMYRDWKKLGLAYEPNTGDNCVHASASPFEGLAEKMNWLKVDPKNDAFGSAAIKAGVSEATLKEWSVDPQVNGKSIFDQLEDMNAKECLDTMAAVSKK